LATEDKHLRDKDLDPLKKKMVAAMDLVTTRPGETYASWRKRVRIAQAVRKFGWKVYCTECGWAGRHMPDDGPLSEGRCRNCMGEIRRVKSKG